MTNREKILRELVTDVVLDEIFCRSIVICPCNHPNEPALCPMYEACKEYTDGHSDFGKYMAAFKKWLEEPWKGNYRY